MLLWRGGGAANGEGRAAPGELWLPAEGPLHLGRWVVVGSGDWDDWVKSVLGSSSGRRSSDAGVEGSTARAKLKSSLRGRMTSQQTKAARRPERAQLLVITNQSFSQN